MAIHVYQVGYDLIRPGQNYQPLWDYLSRIGVRAMLSAWLVETTLLSGELRTEIQRFTDNNDRILITEITNSNWATWNLLPGAADWLKRRFP